MLVGTDALLTLQLQTLVGDVAGFTLVNADCVLIGEEPRIAPLREQMRERLAEAVGADAEQINVRATTTDKLGFTGRGQGLAAQAVALVKPAG
jgi:2-C-methyl-D-erythritol 2,4-cyclodiphosphate synthase